MNIEDLLNMLKSANITINAINIQTGAGTMFTGPTQINPQAAAPEKSRHVMPACEFCGRSDGNDLYADGWGGYSHASCRKQAANDAWYRRHASTWSRPTVDQEVVIDHPVSEPEPAPEPQLLQLSAPAPFSLADYLRELEARYSKSYSEVRANGIKFGMAQADEMRKMPTEFVRRSHERQYSKRRR